MNRGRFGSTCALGAWFWVLPLPGCLTPPEGALPEDLQVIDCTWTLAPDIPSWPGEGLIPFRREVVATVDRDGFASALYHTPEHLGTHVDAPAHFLAGGATIEELRARQLVAPAVVVDVRGSVDRDPDYTLQIADLEAWEQAHGPMPRDSIVLLLTGWGERWPDTSRVRNAGEDGVMHFPGFSPASLDWLLEHVEPRALGIDTLSVDPGRSRDFPVHKKGGGAGLFFLENVAHLEALPPRGSTMVVAPVKIEGATGGQARVLAFRRPGERKIHLSW